MTTIRVAHRWFRNGCSSEGDGGRAEVILAWRKSSYSSGEGGECVEVATCSSAVHVRDSKNITRPGLSLAPTAWTVFLGFVSEV
ncbi:DUF397 domain-containing protein [Streptomyces sp. NPDC057067]|uniref:DUF397 domain-containing protein n=1 Tax=Streptomyces TaxID=1883 RepID=UPI0033B1B481